MGHMNVVGKGVVIGKLVNVNVGINMGALMDSEGLGCCVTVGITLHIEYVKSKTLHKITSIVIYHYPTLCRQY
jgi:hypothetical protein